MVQILRLAALGAGVASLWYGFYGTKSMIANKTQQGVTGLVMAILFAGLAYVCA